MSAEYTIEADPSRDLVRIRMAGFFTEKDIRDFLEARRIAHAKLTCGPNQHLTLNDVRDMKIQAQGVVDSFRRMLADPAFRSRRLAFVAGPTLTRSQLMRAVAGRDVRCFENVWAAETWLHSKDARAA